MNWLFVLNSKHNKMARYPVIFYRFPARTRAFLARVLVACLLVAGLPAGAQQADAAGEVRRVDVAGGKVTLKHGPIPDLQLPAITLVYQAPSALLQDLKPGDKVRFSARRDKQHYVVTAISR